MNTKDLHTLKSFGLSNNDITVYSSLLEMGRVKTGKIIEASGLASSRVYEALRRLTEKGLVSYLVRNNVKHYKAELPDRLIEESDKSLEQLKKLSKQLKEVPLKKTDRNETNIYEGTHGFKVAFDQHLNQIEKGEPVAIIAFGLHTVQKGPHRSLWSFFSEVDTRTFSKTKNVRMLLDKELDKTLRTERTHYKKYALRFLPKEYFGPIAINLTKKQVMLSVWGNKPTIFTLNNPVIVESFWKNFEVLWSIGKK